MESEELIRVASGVFRKDLSPEDKEKAKQIISWQKNALSAAKSKNLALCPAVSSLKSYLLDLLDDHNNSIIRMYSSRMLSELPKEWIVFQSIEDWMQCINYSINRAPVFEERQFFPMSKLFVFFMFTPSGSILFRDDEFNRRVTRVLNSWCAFLDSYESRKVLNPSKCSPPIDGWLSPDSQHQFGLDQCINYKYRNSPDNVYWGFKSFNGFFNRHMDLEKFRPMGVYEGKNQIDCAVVSPNDGTVYRIERNVGLSGKFWLKGQEYSLYDMMGGGLDLEGKRTSRAMIENFVGGDVIQSFLGGPDYHRWHAPISGKVIEVRRIPGMTFSLLRDVGLDLDAGVKSQGYGTMVNTRAIIIIENPAFGKVAIIPIGITEISSIRFSVKKGDEISKGKELGYFSYGGSSLALVFEPGMIRRFENYCQPKSETTSCTSKDSTANDQGRLLVRSTLAIANIKSSKRSHEEI